MKSRKCHSEAEEVGMEDSASQRAIPKFASFRPRNTPSAQRQEKVVSQRTSETSHNGGKTTETYHVRAGNEHCVKLEARPNYSSNFSKVASIVDKDISQSFVVDGTGDPNNLTFGALHRYGTSSYSRIGAGNVVGLPKSQRIDRAVSDSKGLILSNHADGSLGKKDRLALWRPIHDETRELRIRPGKLLGSDFTTSPDYVSLEAAWSVKRRRGDAQSHINPSVSSDGCETDYRSVEAEAKMKSEPADQDLIYDSDASIAQDDDGSSPLNQEKLARETMIQLSRRVEVEPSNYDAWLNMINHQDKMLGLGHRKSSTIAERRSIAEIKASIYEKALVKVKDPEGQEALILGFMEEASKLWEGHILLSRWKIMLQRNPSSLRLWTKYIDFKQTSIGSFKYEEVRSDYLDCLSLLQRARIDNRQSTFVQQNIFDSQIYVLLRMTRFMEEAGYLENAIAAWQALLEYQFFRPASVQANESAVSSFEAFWESEVPRIGEHSAEGWARFCEKQREPPQPRKQAPDAPIDESDIWTSWPDSEHRNSLRSRKPARTSDDVAEQDPYRVILFSDVRPFLVDSPSDSGKQAILDAYLAFYNLPSYQAESLDGHSRLWGRDGFVRKYGLESDGNVQDLGRPPKFDRHATSSETVEVDDYDPSRSKPGRDPFEFPIPDYQVSSDSLFANSGSWFSVFDAWLAKYSRDDVLVDWLLLSLQMLINIGAGADSLAVFVLALELRKSPGTVRKTAKNMLKKRPSSAPLYNAYAIIEYRLGNTSKGEDVLAASIKMGRQLDGVDQRGSPLLLRTWIWEILSTGQVQEAFQRLLAVGSEESQLSNSKLNLSESPGSVKPALLLRTERALTATRDYMLSFSSYTQAAFAIECLILFAYLRNNQSLSAAAAAFKSNLALMSSHAHPSSPGHEYLHQSFSRLLFEHVTHTHHFKPSEIRFLLSESIVQFPQNTIFLSLYVWNEGRFRMDDRVRSILKDVVLTGGRDAIGRAKESVVSHFFAIYTELHRGLAFGSNTSTIRNTFERAIQSVSGAHCPGLWKDYFYFEYSRRETEKAKAVLRRAVGACPWVKELYLLAFKQLSDDPARGRAELSGMYELIVDKELRVHTALEGSLDEAP